jgi:hypothetical protein
MTKLQPSPALPRLLAFSGGVVVLLSFRSPPLVLMPHRLQLTVSIPYSRLHGAAVCVVWRMVFRLSTGELPRSLAFARRD